MAMEKITHNRHAGFSLIEMMIAVSISMVILLAVISMLTDASRSHMELNRSSQLIENGRFSMDQLYEDLRHAGYYGYFFYEDIDTPSTLPDPCETDSAALLLAAMALPIQGYNATSTTTRPDLSATSCTSSILTDTNLNPGSDILVIRRADTATLLASPVTNEVYLQSNVNTADIQYGDSAATIPGDRADDGANTLFAVNGTTPANIHKYHVRLYYIAPCSSGSSTVVEGACLSTDNGVPTLTQLELGVVSGAPTMVITPLAEGVEYMKLTYGIDNSPTTTNSITGLIGDGVPDTYTDSPTLSQWRSVVSVQVNLLVRAPQTSAGHTDDKDFILGEVLDPDADRALHADYIPAANDNFKRHVFKSEIRLTNLAGPREVP
jgi:type IV pilus assembly protein PilW